VTATFTIEDCQVFRSDTGRPYLHRGGIGELIPAGDCPSESEALQSIPDGPVRVTITVESLAIPPTDNPHATGYPPHP
jgi:hypothetical protein